MIDRAEISSEKIVTKQLIDEISYSQYIILLTNGILQIVARLAAVI